MHNLKTSSSCTCEASAEIKKEREDTKVHKFLFGLDEPRFSTIRSQIIDEKPLPDLNIVYSRVIHDEQHLLTKCSKKAKHDAVGFSIQIELPKQSTPSVAATVATRSRDPSRFCTHCNRKVHEVSECFLVHGYPDWFYEQQQQQRSAPTSNLQGRGGRFNNSSGRGRGCANASRTSPMNQVANTTSNASSDQIVALISLLQNQQTQLSTNYFSGKTKLSDVIIDNGASHHMTCNLSLLRDVREIIPSAVTFPDGPLLEQLNLGLCH